VDRAADRSVARQVADALREEIQTGALPPGVPLPSEVALTQRFGVARATARAAVAVLRAEGLIITYAGRGSFVRGPAEVVTVLVPPGATITARVPSDLERRAGGLSEGVPLLVVLAPDGTEAVHRADRTRLQVPPA